MITLIARCSVQLAKRVARVADRKSLTHEALVLLAVHDLCDRELGKVRGRKAGISPWKKPAPPRRR